MSKGKERLVAAVLLAASSPAAAQQADDTAQKTRLAQACAIEMNLSEAGCRCLSDRAMTDLNELQRDYLLASAIAPRAADRIGRSISQVDIQVLARFLVTAGQECSAK
jgi:hypothetical protein